MSIRLIDLGWDKELNAAVHTDHSHICIICPFIKLHAIKRLFSDNKPAKIQVITRFHLGDFAEGVSDISALRWLLNNGAQIRGIRNLHAKLYLFGMKRAVVTSANLTDAALTKNHELGIVVEDAGIVNQCKLYFDNLWQLAGQDLSAACLDEWEQKVKTHLILGAHPASASSLADEGIDIGIAAEPTTPLSWISYADQAFVKFFGKSDDRASRSSLVFDEVKSSGCHWACTYPKDKRPRQVKDGAVMFMGWLVNEPNDVLIFGRAVGMHYVPLQDDASIEDITNRSWKAQWPHYVRVHHAEFVAGSLSNGVSLSKLMDDLGSNAFVPTQRNVARGQGNINPRKAYMRRASVELSPQGIAWLNDHLEAAFAQHGKLPPSMLKSLDWPGSL